MLKKEGLAKFDKNGINGFMNETYKSCILNFKFLFCQCLSSYILKYMCIIYKIAI